MKIHLITKDQLDADNNYIGKVDLSDFDGAIESAGYLGWVKVKSLKAKFYILFRAGSGIKAGEGIKAGLGIKAGSGIKAGLGIKAGEGIRAGLGIKAGVGIEAGLGIKAGWGIEAGEGIEAGFSICAKTLSCKLRIFAGLCLWRLPTKEETQVVVEKLENGQIAFGELVIKPAPAPVNTCSNKVVEIDGKKYKPMEIL